eukprot:CAMPEP_0196688100 /NCGR_PEP_ID=MMETSP1090-20130531/15802_1 /TAXON_ID=37098 /ORGANISM="Isochrysis sp, Strain CCMP1244" /LENGTH=81 /DNA_ID=CAMNT_0042026959 /DNA_START=156 /DNA_END=397 /DNA_ORIENTATION=-
MRTVSHMSGSRGPTCGSIHATATGASDARARQVSPARHGRAPPNHNAGRQASSQSACGRGSAAPASRQARGAPPSCLHQRP